MLYGLVSKTIILNSSLIILNGLQQIQRKSGAPRDLFGEIYILLGNFPRWHFHRKKKQI